MQIIPIYATVPAALTWIKDVSNLGSINIVRESAAMKAADGL